jgi:hypothetical protein
MANLVGREQRMLAEICDRPRFAGHSARLSGPADYPYLRVTARDWQPEVLSLVVGPTAYVQCYKDLGFHDSVFWLPPNPRVEAVAELNCSDEIDSLRIFDRPPFAQEPGFPAYMLWGASGAACWEVGGFRGGTRRLPFLFFEEPAHARCGARQPLLPGR